MKFIRRIFTIHKRVSCHSGKFVNKWKHPIMKWSYFPSIQYRKELLANADSEEDTWKCPQLMKNLLMRYKKAKLLSSAQIQSGNYLLD